MREEESREKGRKGRREGGDGVGERKEEAYERNEWW